MSVPLKRPRVATTPSSGPVACGADAPRLTGRSFVIVAVAALVAIVATVVSAPRAEAAPAGFVTRCGIHFCLDGRTFYFAGANTYDVFTYGGSWGETETTYMDKARIDAHFAHLQQDKVTVLRLWMFSHESWHGFEPTKGVYNDQQFALFDYAIESARAHNVRLIPVFENYWEAYGGIDTRLSWEGLTGGHPGRAKFFNKQQCPGCFTQYKNYVNYALNRTNHYSGIKYKDDPTIMAWELMNEPRYQDVSAAENISGATLRAWVDEMGAYIKGIDPNHLLGTGLEAHESRYGFGGNEGNPFIYIHQSPYIDFTSAHPYPTEGWAGLDIPRTRALIRQWISDSHDVVGKPFFMGEWNVHSDYTNWWTQIYAELEASDADGSAFWWYKDGSGGGGFDTTFGTAHLSVFRAHSDRMIAKSGGPPPTPRPSSSASPSRSPSASPSPSPSRSASPSASPSRSASASPSPSRSASASPSPTPSRSASPSASSSVNPTGCAVTYALNDWGSGFTANVTITNRGASAINGWALTWTFAGNQAVTNAWNATVTASGAAVTARNMAYNNIIGANGGTATFGFQASYSGTNAVPASFALNGTACTRI